MSSSPLWSRVWCLNGYIKRVELRLDIIHVKFSWSFIMSLSRNQLTDVHHGVSPLMVVGVEMHHGKLLE